MKNPVPSSGLFATLNSTEELTAYIEQLSGQEKALAYTIAMMTFNLAHKLVEEQHIKEGV